MTDKIRKSLDRLSSALERLDPSDQESRKKLSALIGEVERRVANSPGKDQDRNLGDDLSRAALHFKVRHPVISEALDEIKAALYSIGL